ncbi:MAG: MFS transporter [Oscillospiraceae bacterium]
MAKITGVFKRIKSSLFFGLGVDRLTTEFRKFALMHVVYLLATSTTMVFVNTLLMRVSTDDNIALQYNIVHFSFVSIAMVAAAILMRKLTNKKIIFIGVGMSMITYLLVLVFMNTLDIFYPVVAATHGIATGFYWIIYFDSLMKYSTDDTRDVAMNFIGVCGGFVSLIMPLACGYTIGAFAGFTGYYVMFAILFLVAGVAVYLVTRLDVEQPDHKKSQFFRLIKNTYTKKVWFFVIHMDFFKGIREGAFSFFLNVLLFSIVKSEGLVGINTFLVGGTSMIACVIASKISRPSNRIRYMAIATILLTIITTILFIELNTVTVLMLSIANAMLSVFMVNPVTTTLYTVFDKVPYAKELKNETFAVTEWYKNAGRISGIVFIMIMPDGGFWSVLSLAILVLTQIVTAIFAKITMDCLKKDYGEEQLDA